MTFIAFEGIDGASKSTQMPIIHKWLMANYYPFSQIREPNDNYMMKAIKSVNGYKFEFEKEILALLFAADRLITRDNLVWASDRNYGTLADRSFLSSLAYQGDNEWVRDLNRFAAIPDLIVYFDVDVEEALERCKRDNPFEKKDVLIRAKATYDKIYESGEFNMVKIDANKSKEEVTEQIKKVIGEFLK